MNPIWRTAHSLDVLVHEVDKLAPHRSRVSDGTIGDAAHATRLSDHNPWVILAGIGIVRARDFTQDPAGGLDCDRLAHELVELMKAGHPALKSGAYIIWDGKILSFDRLDEGWRPYTHGDPHTGHLHLSVSGPTTRTPPGYDSTRPWKITLTAPRPPAKPKKRAPAKKAAPKPKPKKRAPAKKAAPKPKAKPAAAETSHAGLVPFPGRNHFTLGEYCRHGYVGTLDAWLIEAGYATHHDGAAYQAGPLFSINTRANVASFQRSRPGLASDADGQPGPSTWRLLQLAAKAA